MDKKKSYILEGLAVLAVFVSGFILRFKFLYCTTADTDCFTLWFNYIRDNGGIAAFKTFIGDYNAPYMWILFLATLFPVRDIVMVKILAALFDIPGFVVGFLFVRELVLEAGKGKDLSRRLGELGSALVWLSPITVGNSGYQGQLEGLWTFTGFLSVYFAHKKRPVLSMIMMGIAFGMKPQGIFFLPFLFLIYYRSQVFSVLHFLIIPLTIQVLSIPAMIGGCPFYIFWEKFFTQTNLCPAVYYYYPNFWIWFRDLPYYVFGKVGIGMMLTVFLLYTVRFAKDSRERKWSMAMDLELALWSLMTCAMFLPVMHERYNYPAEVMLPVLSIVDKKYRVPAGVLMVSGLLCNGMSYYGWGKPEFYGLSLLNMAVYAFLTAGVIGTVCGRGAVTSSKVSASVKGGAV